MLTRNKAIEALAAYMASTHQTQTEIARHLNVTPQALNNWLARRREPSYAAYEKIMELLEENHAATDEDLSANTQPSMNRFCQKQNFG